MCVKCANFFSRDGEFFCELGHNEIMNEWWELYGEKEMGTSPNPDCFKTRPFKQLLLEEWDKQWKQYHK